MAQSCTTSPTATRVADITSTILSTTFTLSTSIINGDSGGTADTTCETIIPTASSAIPSVLCRTITARPAPQTTVISIPITQTTITTIPGGTETLYGTACSNVPGNDPNTNTPTSVTPTTAVITTQTITTLPDGQVRTSTLTTTTISTPASAPTEASSTRSTPVAAIAGGTAGGIVCILLFVGICFWMKRRKRWDDIYEDDIVSVGEHKRPESYAPQSHSNHIASPPSSPRPPSTIQAHSVLSQPTSPGPYNQPNPHSPTPSNPFMTPTGPGPQAMYNQPGPVTPVAAPSFVPFNMQQQHQNQHAQGRYNKPQHAVEPELPMSQGYMTYNSPPPSNKLEQMNAPYRDSTMLNANGAGPSSAGGSSGDYFSGYAHSQGGSNSTSGGGGGGHTRPLSSTSAASSVAPLVAGHGSITSTHSPRTSVSGRPSEKVGPGFTIHNQTEHPDENEEKGAGSGSAANAVPPPAYTE